MNIKLNEQNPDDQINGVIKMKRERFRCQIRQTKNENLFQINRTKLSNQNLYYEEDVKQMGQALESFQLMVDESHFSLVENQINQIIQIYQNLNQNSSQSFLREGFILQINTFINNSSLIYCLNPDLSRQSSMQTSVCQLFCQIIAYCDLSCPFHSNLIEQIMLLKDQLIDNLLYILENPANIELRQQGILCLGNLIMDSRVFGDIFLTEQRYNLLIKVAINESNLFIDFTWLFNSLSYQLGKLSVETLEPLFQVIDRYLCFQDISLKIKILDTLKKILQLSSFQTDFAKRCARLNNFSGLVKELNRPQMLPQIVEFVMSVYGSIEDYYEYCNSQDIGHCLQFTDLLSTMDFNLSLAQSQLRKIIYWSLSNLIYDKSCAKDVIQHPKLIDKIMEVAIAETLNCQQEISYIFLNLVMIGSAEESVVLLNKGLLQILKVFLSDRQLKVNATNILIHMMDLAQVAISDKSMNDFHTVLRSLKKSLEDLNMEKILLNDQTNTDEIQNKIEYFFFNN